MMSLIDISIKITCADRGIFVRGGGGPGPTDRKSCFSFLLVFYRGAPNNGYFKENYNFQDCWWVQHFSGDTKFSRGWGVQLFPEAVQSLTPIETYGTCDFPGGGGGVPLSPFWISAWIKISLCVRSVNRI